MNKRVSFAFVSLILTVFSNSALATKEVGNGGNVIMCPDAYKLLDYYELELNGGKLLLNASLGSYPAILTDLFNRWKTVAPKRMAQYAQWLKDFPSEAGIYPEIQIPPTEDTGVIAIPQGCWLEPAAFQRPDSQIMPGVKRYTISKRIWDQLPEVQKAGLVLHELIYREGIIAGHKTSFPTRYFNGFLASATPEANSYAEVVQQMPLEWVEYGSGLVIQLGTTGTFNGAPIFRRNSKITQKGFLIGPYNSGNEGAAYSDLVGNVISERLKIEFDLPLPVTATAHDRLILFRNNEFQMDLTLKKVQVKSMAISFDRFSVKVIQLPIHLWTFRLFGNEGRIRAQFEAGDVGLRRSLTTDPDSTFFVQPNGTVIRSITQLLLDNDGNGFGGTLMTSSGETWVFASNQVGYIKK